MSLGHKGKKHIPYEQRKTGIALWRGSNFSLRTLKKGDDMFCPGLFINFSYDFQFVTISFVVFPLFSP